MAVPPSGPLVAIVGPCASGKSTLAEALKARGFRVREVAQEHSYVPAMWQRMTNPDVLIFLDASFEVSTSRKALDWSVSEYEEEQRRLAHARECCDLYLLTDRMKPEDVLQAVLNALGLEDQSAQGV
jgi:deoxyadenosine/deoxycytidine kinase